MGAPALPLRNKGLNRIKVTNIVRQVNQTGKNKHQN